LEESLAVQVSTIQVAADPTRIQDKEMHDGASGKEDQVKYGGTYFRLLRSGRSVSTSMEQKNSIDYANRNFGNLKLISERAVDGVKEALSDEDWRRVGHRGKVFHEVYEEKKLEKREKKKL
jgi:hypothetical protein